MRRTSLVVPLVAAALAAWVACRPSPVGPAGSGAAGGRGTVVRVVDGDTLLVSLGGRHERVRLIGIDTPESVKPGTPVQCFAIEASTRTHQLLPKGTGVRLERDVELRDHFRRLLAYVYREADGLFVNAALAREGYALPYTFPPNVAHAEELAAAAADARADRRGLWSRCRSPDAPLEAHTRR